MYLLIEIMHKSVVYWKLCNKDYLLLCWHKHGCKDLKLCQLIFLNTYFVNHTLVFTIESKLTHCFWNIKNAITEKFTFLKTYSKHAEQINFMKIFFVNLVISYEWKSPCFYETPVVRQSKLNVFHCSYISNEILLLILENRDSFSLLLSVVVLYKIEIIRESFRALR